MTFKAYDLLISHCHGESYYIFCPPTGIGFWRRGGCVISDGKIDVYEINILKSEIRLVRSSAIYKDDTGCGSQSENFLVKRQYVYLVCEENENHMIISGAECLPDDKYWVRIIKDKQAGECRFHVLYCLKEFIWKI